MPLDEFTSGYIACALWSSVDDNAIPLDREFTITDFTPEAVARMIHDCALFQLKNDLAGYPLDQAGHDFWLSRNRLIGGFKEKFYGTNLRCEKLADAAVAFRPCTVQTVVVWKSKVRGKIRHFV